MARSTFSGGGGLATSSSETRNTMMDTPRGGRRLVSQLDRFHDARVLALRLGYDAAGAGHDERVSLSIECELHDDGRAEIACQGVFEIAGSDLMSENTILELDVRTKGEYAPSDLAWALHVDPADAEKDKRYASLASRMRSGELIEVMFA